MCSLNTGINLFCLLHRHTRWFIRMRNVNSLKILQIITQNYLQVGPTRRGTKEIVYWMKTFARSCIPDILYWSFSVRFFWFRLLCRDERGDRYNFLLMQTFTIFLRNVFDKKTKTSSAFCLSLHVAHEQRTLQIFLLRSRIWVVSRKSLSVSLIRHL